MPFRLRLFLLVWDIKIAKNRLQVTQYKIIRFVLKMDPKSHVGAYEFKSIRRLQVSYRVDQIILIHVLKANPDSRPLYGLQFYTSKFSTFLWH